MRLQTAKLAYIITILGFVLTSCDEGTKNSPYLKGSPPHYINSHYGLDVALSGDLPVCVDDNGIIMSHGFTILLTKGASCADRNPGSYPLINVYADFAADLDDVNTTEQLAQERCHGMTRVDATNLRVPGHDTAICSGPFIYKDADGKLVAPQNLVETTAFVWATNEQSIELRVRLVTSEVHLPRDTETLKSVLDGIKSVGR